MWQQIKYFFEKWYRWEFWPWQLFYLPVYFYYLFQVIRHRSLFYYSSVNPGIENGGMLYDSKFRILNQFESHLIPKTLFVPKNYNYDPESLKELLNRKVLQFPLILKPDLGERGKLVRKVENLTELITHLHRFHCDYLIQEYIDYPIEVGIFYYRFPDSSEGKISSVVIKEFLHIVGDGKHTVRELMAMNLRSNMQIPTIALEKKILLTETPSAGEKILLQPIGNHCKGTTFINGNHLITSELTAVFDSLSQQVKGFYYGRYDLRCKSLEALQNGKGFKILELNGAKSEPAHIYDTNYPLLKAYQDLLHHWQVMSKICSINYRDGIPYQDFRLGIKSWISFLQMHKVRT
jgi:hypothetical protein